MNFKCYMDVDGGDSIDLYARYTGSIVIERGNGLLDIYIKDTAELKKMRKIIKKAIKNGKRMARKDRKQMDRALS